MLILIINDIAFNIFNEIFPTGKGKQLLPFEEKQKNTFLEPLQLKNQYRTVA